MALIRGRSLFEGGVYLKIGRNKELFLIVLIVFRIEITELTSFDFDYILAAALIGVNTVYLYKQGLHYSLQERSKPESDGCACPTQ